MKLAGDADRPLDPSAQPGSTSLAEPPLPADDPTLFELDLRGLRERWASTAARPPMTAEAMIGADRRAQALGVPGERLMEQAGTATAAAAHALAVDTERWGRGPIVILAGPGNNGERLRGRATPGTGRLGRGRGIRSDRVPPGRGRGPEPGTASSASRRSS